MTHIEYFKIRSQIENPDYLDLAILNSLIQSLSDSEVCSLFDLTFKQEYHIRHYILKKISDDISKKFTTDHQNLIKTLLKKLREKGFDKKECCAFSLDFMYNKLPLRYKNLILRSFLNSKSSRNRNRALKRINSEWHNRYIKTIESIWDCHKDSSCLDIIINHFPNDFLLSNYNELKLFADQYQLSRLFIRIGSLKHELLEELKNIDQITYSYVLAKLNKRFDSQQASEILKNNHKDKRIGLLLWCFGKMELWDNIIEFDLKFKVKYKRALIDNIINH